MLNGRVVRELGSRAVWGSDIIKVDGRDIPVTQNRIYLMLNKPFAYVSTLMDPEERPVVADLLKDVGQRVYPVGRLDFDSLGLLLFTNDGEWAHRLTHPRYHVPRTYKITLEGEISGEASKALSRGMELDDGFTGPSKVAVLRKSGGRSVIRITITMGKSRVLRRMLETLGLKVIHLIRIGFGNLELGDLKIGHYRHLETDEVRGLKKMVGIP